MLDRGTQDVENLCLAEDVMTLSANLSGNESRDDAESFHRKVNDIAVPTA